ncbi:MAG: type II toxin-antitoxin system PemK/MazF family toxin, partial [Bacteroidota bacterium]
MLMFLKLQKKVWLITSNVLTMNQGEIWQALLSPVQGREQDGSRPVLIISGNLLNENTEIVIVCPLTSKLKRYHGNLIMEPTMQNGLDKTSEVLTWQIRTISKTRLSKKIGSVPIADVKKVHKTLNEILVY